MGKRLAEYNRKKREVQKSKQVGHTAPCSGEPISQYYSIGAVIAVGVIGGLGYYIYRTKKGESHPQPQPPQQQQPPQSNKFEMD